MRSFLLRGDRKCLPPESHHTPYEKGVEGPITWDNYAPYTNVLWLAYLYEYLIANFKGDRKDVVRLKRLSKEMWAHLNPEARSSVPCFASAGDVVRYAVEAGWIHEEQLMGTDGSTLLLEREDSIIVSLFGGDGDAAECPSLRRSPRRRQP
jgi:serine/threonine-protein kinase haspin